MRQGERVASNEKTWRFLYHVKKEMFLFRKGVGEKTLLKYLEILVVSFVFCKGVRNVV